MDAEGCTDDTLVGAEAAVLSDEPDSDEKPFFEDDDSMADPALLPEATALDDCASEDGADCAKESPWPEVDADGREEAVADELGGNSWASERSGMTLAKNCPLSSWKRTKVLPWPMLPANTGRSPSPPAFMFRPDPREGVDAPPCPVLAVPI